MIVKVVDASAIAAICFVEPNRQSVIDVLDDTDLFAPTLIDFELANICWKRSRRDPDNAEQYRQQLLTRQALQITLCPVTFNDVVTSAIETGLTAYDASYLWLAREMNVELVTLDKRLQLAAQTMGLVLR